MKKLIAFALVMILCFSLCMPAWARDAGTVGITTTISSAGDRTAAITSDGTLWMWGSFVTPSINKYGGMDMGYQKSPVKIMSDVASVSCSDYYTAAIKKDGSLWMWGLNSSGQLGNGEQGDTTFNGQVYQLSPVKIMDGVAAVSCGFNHTAVIKTDGSLWLFGNNQYGEIGNNHVGNATRIGDDIKKTEYPIQTVPVKIMDDVICVSCGWDFTAAVKNDGTLWTWGDNQNGQLGNGERGQYGDIVNGALIHYRNDRYIPVKILDDVVSVSCGGAHAAAVKNDGSLWIWGQNNNGCLGFGYTSAAEADGHNTTVPLKVMEGVASVSCSTDITAAITMDGSLWEWGAIYNGRDTRQFTGTPAKVMDNCLVVNAHSIAMFVIKQDGNLYGWGRTEYLGTGKGIGVSYNSDEQLTPVEIFGNMALPNNTSPIIVPDVPSSWAKGEVEAATLAGLVPENLQKNYQQPVSRADVAQMFINLIEQSSGKSVDRLMNEKGVSINKDAFTDTSDYAVLAANALGIINGTGNSKFSPDGTFTRSQIAAIINRVARALGINTDGYAHSFTDVVGHWVDSELGWLSSVGIINGVGNNQFSPDTELTTEQAIAITYRALQVLKQ